ncbi:MAG TPA: penicillin-binding protein activator LpoB [Candidatus Kryptobacter bacterium]|nr:penicillin-binding protein activator LpoB [Candidatus Kryptobacter bacterium]
MQTKTKHFQPLVLAVAMITMPLLLSACGPAVKVTRVNPSSETDLSGYWNDTDSRLVAEKMISDLQTSPWVDKFEQENNRKPVVIVGRITNRSYEHIDVETFVKNLEAALVNGGIVKFVASSKERGQIRAERKDQAEHASEDTQKEPGQETGADFMLIGNISSIIDKEGGETVKYYQVDLELDNVTTNEKAWIGEKKIKKIVNQASYGF